MLRSLRDLERYTVHATDGDIGTVKDFLLNDESWGVRYLVVDAGGLVLARRVLIDSISFRQLDWATHLFHVALSRKAAEGSPDAETRRPVSRQHGEDSERAPSTNELHLQSMNEVRGYHVQGIDEAVGRVEDFIVDDQTWAIRYLVIDTSNRWFGKKVLVAPHWASGVSWAERKVHMALTRQVIKDSPEWQPSAPINRQYEANLYDYYGRPVYWEAALPPPPPGTLRGKDREGP